MHDLGKLIVESFTKQLIESIFAKTGLCGMTSSKALYVQSRVFCLNSENMFFECV